MHKWPGVTRRLCWEAARTPWPSWVDSRGHFHARLGQRFDLIGSRATWLVCRICLICMLTWRGCGLLSELSQHLCWCMELQAAQGRWLIPCIYICFPQSTNKLLQSTWAVDTSRRTDPDLASNTVAWKLKLWVQKVSENLTIKFKSLNIFSYFSHISVHGFNALNWT